MTNELPELTDKLLCEQVDRIADQLVQDFGRMLILEATTAPIDGVIIPNALVNFCGKIILRHARHMNFTDEALIETIHHMNRALLEGALESVHKKEFINETEPGAI